METQQLHPISREDLVASAAVTRLRRLVDAPRTCLFMTLGQTLGIPARPMRVQKVDEQGSVWFFSSRSSAKNAAIGEDRRVQLSFANADRSEYLVVLGNARIHLDRARMKALWTPSLRAWFNHGSDDPSLSLIEVVPTRIHYWMPEGWNKGSLWKRVRAALTGRSIPERQGELVL
ncbi:MAG: pyridoxamine 5'-phosphate oxidase family protein [Flavobacteriales bacterium]